MHAISLWLFSDLLDKYSTALPLGGKEIILETYKKAAATEIATATMTIRINIAIKLCF
jgi:hypothetical protein